MRSPGKSCGPSVAVPGAGMGRQHAPGCPVLLGRRGMLRTAGAGEGGTGHRELFRLHHPGLKYRSNPLHTQTPPPFPRAARYIFLREPRTGGAPRRARGAGGPRPPAPPPARPASAGRRNSSAFLPCASSLFLPLPGAAASFPTSTLPKLFSRSPERGGLPQLPAAGSRLLLNFWGSRMSKMEKEIL